MRNLVIVICFAFGVIPLGIAIGVSSTEREVRTYFEMPAYVGTVPENVREAILDGVPTGSSRPKVESFLFLRGIGRDNNSLCGTRTSGTILTCKIGLHDSLWKVVRETYTVSFYFDSDQKLQDVQVKSGFSALRRPRIEHDRWSKAVGLRS